MTSNRVTANKLIPDKSTQLVSVRRAETIDSSKIISGLTDVLMDCVEGGASVGFMQTLPRAQAEKFWRGLAYDVALGRRILMVAEDEDGAIVGTVQAIVGQPDNQPHRADIAKMLVHRKLRRQGLATLLMKAVESAAASAGKTLLVLDTVTGGDAERLYTKLGWQLSGHIPDYALWPTGELCSTSIFYKRLPTSK
jgi:GNAT superfamily N-acetyltransferase